MRALWARSTKNNRGLLYVLDLAIVATILLQFTFVISARASLEAESSSLVGGVTAITDANASRGAGIIFKAVTDCVGVTVRPGDNIQSIVNANSTGTTYCLQAGTYREQSIVPKQNDRFIGVGTAVLNGSRVLTNFIQEGSIWRIGGQSQEGQIHGECPPDAPRCNYPEEVFINNVRMTHVASKAQVTFGTWFFDYPADTIYIGENPTGKTVETSVTRTAIAGYVGGVTVSNITVEKYANPAQTGAVMAGNGPGGPEIQIAGWTIDSVIAQNNHGGGIEWVHATGMIVKNSKVLRNGQIGMGGVGTNVLVENNEIAYNNDANYNYGWEGGGTKFALTNGLIVRNNDVHHNIGPGLWTDIDNRNVLYEDNRVYNNDSAGIFHEISYNAIIRRNIVEANGIRDNAWCYGAGIQISASRDVEVYDNTLKNNARSIVGIQQTRGGDKIVVNMKVHHNKVTNTNVNGSVTGICRDNADDVYSAASGNKFDYNQYFGSGQGFSWNDQGFGNDFLTWQSYGQDPNGSLVL